MADDNKNQNPNAGNGGEGGDNKHVNNQNPNPNNNNGGNQDDGKSIPKYRFDEVSERLQKLEAEKEEREKKDREAADKKLVEDKKFEELAAKRESDLNSANTTIREMKIERAVERVASKLGAVDSEAVIKLIDKSALKVDKDGNVENAEEVVKALLEAKPFLKGSGDGSPANVGGGSNPAQPAGNKKPISWVREKWADPSWVRAKHDDLGGLTGEEYLNKIERDGMIDYNL